MIVSDPIYSSSMAVVYLKYINKQFKHSNRKYQPNNSSISYIDTLFFMTMVVTMMLMMTMMMIDDDVDDDDDDC